MNFLYLNERDLVKTCFEIEQRGVLIDTPYVRKALEHERREIETAKKNFETDTGYPFQDSSKLFAKIFDERGEPYPRTEKGNPSFTGDFLEVADTPTTRLIQAVRDAEKRAGTYYSSFLHYQAWDQRLHANIRQAGTTTGRFSYSNPNLQNIPRENTKADDEKEFLVRKSFIPEHGFNFVSLDYSQVEYRLMLDYAGERKIIKAVMDGEDLHQTTADIVGVSRDYAKTLNFAILYGAGIAKIAQMLRISEAQATDLKATYLSRLPNVRRFVRQVMAVGESRGYVVNWMGRRCHIRYKSEAYKLPNHLIQGGAADVIKVAMNQISPLLRGTRSGMVVQIHDDILSEMHHQELDLIAQMKRIMEKVYVPKNGMYLSVDAQVSTKTWAKRDMVKLL